MIFELSRDYKRAFELIKKGDRIACFLDYEGCRDVAIAELTKPYKDLIVGARGITYIFLFTDFYEEFKKCCDRLNVEFYLPIQGETP
jgi:hypothetical protein